MIASRLMDASSHAALVALDQTRAVAHEQLLAAWREGPLAEWQRAARAAYEEKKQAPARPTPPAPPVLVQHAVIGIASTYGLVTDDLVRFARKTEVRTAYPEGALERARNDLGDELVAALLTIEWPALPAAPPPAPVIEPPEMERAPRVVSNEAARKDDGEAVDAFVGPEDAEPEPHVIRQFGDVAQPSISSEAPSGGVR